MSTPNRPQPSIAIITCYMGKLPWYFDYFVHTVKYNPTVDFFVITDDVSYKQPIPRNVKLIYKSIQEINKIASKKLDLVVNIKTGYKLCDFKPTYGFLFSELLTGYDFWGHGDIDVIFGDIRNFITAKILHAFDIISVRDDYLTGFFLLFRNCSKMNTLFTLSKDYKEVLSSDQHFCFDETNFTHVAFAANVPYDKIKSKIESMNHVVKRMESVGFIRPYFDIHVIEGTPGKIKWENGRIFYDNKYEALLYHLYDFKKTYKPKRMHGKIASTFTITRTKIVQMISKN